MRINGALLVVVCFLALFWGAKLLIGAFAGAGGSVPSGGTGAEGGASRPDTIQALLSGEFKRQPVKNPEEGRGRIRCLVRAHDGVVAAGARVQVTPCDPDANLLEARREYPYYWEEVADASGLVTFRTLPAGAFVVLATRDNDHGVALASVLENGSFAEVLVELWPSHPRTGTVSDAEGAPLANAWIVPIHAPDWLGDSAAYRFLPSMTAEDGSFEHPLLPEGAWQLLVAAPNVAAQLVMPGEDGAYRAVLGKGETLAGRVMIEGKERPLNNAKVGLQAQDRPGERHTVRANGQGYFTFRDLRAAPYTLRLAHDSYQAELEVTLTGDRARALPAATPASRNMKIDPLTGAAIATDASAGPASPAAGASAPARDADLILLQARPSGSIRGRVLESGAEVGAAGVEMAAYAADLSVPAATAISDQAGYYHLKSLAPGSYHLSATRSAEKVFIAETAPESVVEAGKTQPGPVFRSIAAVSLYGQVLDASGMPVSEANIFVAIQGRPGGPMRFGADSEGKFAAGGFFSADQVQVWAVKMGEESAKFGPVTIGDSGLQDILLRIAAP